MHPGLQPVAISCYKYFYRGPFAALIYTRAPSENASDASDVLGKPILCKKANVSELAFSEGARLPVLRITGEVLLVRTL
jgi:hypothetical protein